MPWVQPLTWYHHLPPPPRNGKDDDDRRVDSAIGGGRERWRRVVEDVTLRLVILPAQDAAGAALVRYGAAATTRKDLFWERSCGCP